MIGKLERSKWTPGSLAGLMAVSLTLALWGWSGGVPGVAASEGELVAVSTLVEVPQETISIDVKRASARQVINLIAAKSGRNIIYEGDPDLEVTLLLADANWHLVLDFVLEQIHGVIEEETSQLIRVTTPKVLPYVEFKDAALKTVIDGIASLADASISIDPEVAESGGLVNARFKDQPWTVVLETIVEGQGFMVIKKKGIYRVVSPTILLEQLVTKPFPLKYILPPDKYTPRITTEFVEGRQRSRGAALITGEAGPAVAATGAAEFPLLAALKPSLSPAGEILYDYDLNTLFVTDIEPKIRQIEKILSQIDVEPAQVFVEVKFVTTRNPDVLDFGILWPRDAATGLGSAPLATSTIKRIPRFSPEHQGGRPFSVGVLDFSQLKLALELLKTDDTTEIKQEPKLTVLDNHEATIFVGESVHYAESTASSSQVGTLEFSIQEATGSPVETGFQLLVVPHVVRSEGKVILTVIPEVETLTGEQRGFDLFQIGDESILLPRVSSRTVVTKMVLADGQTAVIGGLVDDRDIKKVTRVPLLSNIPLLGWLFKHQYTEKNKEHIFIFVTVTIVKTGPRMREVYRNYSDYDEILDPAKAEKIREEERKLIIKEAATVETGPEDIQGE